MEDSALIIGAVSLGALAFALIVVWLTLRGNRVAEAAAMRAMALDSLPQAVLLTDDAGALLFANRVWRDYVARPGKEGGLAVLEDNLAPEADNLQTFVRLNAAATAGDTESSDIALIGPDGHKSWYRASVQPAADSKGKLWMPPSRPNRRGWSSFSMIAR